MTKKWTERAAAPAKRKPRLLLIDDKDAQLPILAQDLEKLGGFEVIKLHIKVPDEEAKSKDESIVRVARHHEIINYALDSSNGIDAVVTDLYMRDFFDYGTLVVEDLVKYGFQGPIAVHSGEPSATMEERVKGRGAMGLFDKGDLEKTAAVIHQALKTRGKGRD